MLGNTQSRWEALRHWYSSDLGLLLKEAEQVVLDKALADLFGYYILQLERHAQSNILGASRITRQYVVLSDLHEKRYTGDIYGLSSELPITADSVDVVVLPHTLDFHRRPHQILREVDRILVPEGHVVIVGFSPWSFWGLWRVVMKRSGAVPWSGRFRSIIRIKDWLKLLGFSSEYSETFFFRPPLKTLGLARRLDFLESWGKKLFPFFGGVYIIVAKKEVATMTPIRPKWRPRQRLITSGIVKTYNGCQEE